ncbi:MAG: arylsulfatase [Luteolibacter sp.]|uniref:arylsulfatase n=1 Tax=Luteolibacter sp. TaxID=1962973 RepID=UPI003265E7F4
MTTRARILTAGISFLLGLPATAMNVVFILADDLGYGETGCYGQKKILTPNIDRLASEGSRFTSHYSGSAVCAPARCTLMTGMHTGHAEIRGNQQAQVAFPEFKEGQYPISELVPTLAKVFQKAGYATGAIGKWGLGPVGSTGDPNKKGFDLFFGYNCQAVAHSYYPRFLWRNDKQVEINPEPIPAYATQKEGVVEMDKWIGKTYAPTLMEEEAGKFIAQNSKRPFFLYLAFTEPHVAMHPPKSSVEQYPEAWDAEPYRGEAGYLPHPRPRAAYAAMISDLDRHVGAVRKSLEEAGILDETLIIFTSDNGATHPGAKSSFHTGGADPEFFDSESGLRGWKGSLYEGGIREPLIVRYPGKVPAGVVNDTVGYFPDWFPTLCGAAGLTPPEGLDGINLWPAITGTGKVERADPMLWFFPEYGGQAAVRLGDFKVIRRGLMTKNPGPWEVFNLKGDRSEKKDIAKDHPELVARAVEVLRQEVGENKVFPMAVPGI